MTPVTPPELNLSVVGPLVWVSLGALLVLLGEVLLSRAKSFMGYAITPHLVNSVLAGTAIATLALAATMAFQHAASGVATPFAEGKQLFVLDGFSALITALIALASLLSCALSIHYLDELRINHGEYYALVLFATAGMLLMVSAVDLLPVFLGLELMSIPIYVLAGFDRRKLRSNESALKYFLIGSFASAILLYGMALLYGVAGATSFAAIRASFSLTNPIAVAGLALVIVGFGFKISSVPFHQWTPDVYEGAPAAVTAFMSVTVKLAAFAALLRVIVLSFEPLGDSVADVLWVLAALTMVVGNVMAVIQDNVKRLLAYSSIAHAGYLLIGFVPGTAEGYASVVFYLVCYLFMNLGAFAVVVALASRGRDFENMESLAGLARSRPGLAALMTLFMISLAGIPGTAGFMGKWQVFSAAVAAGEVPLAILGVLMSVVSVYYYLRVPRADVHARARLRAAAASAPARARRSCSACAPSRCSTLGILPNGWIDVLGWARESVRGLLAS